MKMTEYKIMIIEDDSLIRSELKNMLCGNGYGVVTVSNFGMTIEEVIM